MSDFDFDELDRAVSGVISDDSSLSDATVAPAVDVPQSTPAASTPTPPVAPAVRRSSGRFMDVVHPSSDMRSGSAAPQATRRQPVVVQPPAPAVEEPTPDPIDTLEDWQKPLESPFLPDMKVEKRPLGGGSETPSLADFDALELLEAPDDPRIEAHVMPDPLDFAAQPEPETPTEVVEEVIETPAEPEVETFPEIVTETVVEEEIIETPKVEAVESGSHDSVGYGQGAFQTEEAQNIPAGPSSISQQYTEQPSSSPESGAIYDTEAYHQPLAPIAKKKSGAWVILWILLIVLLGGGAGAAFYFYVMPML